jgi:hypothetical protein
MCYNIGPRDKCYKTFYVRNLRMFVKAKVLVSGKPIQPSLMFASKARAYPSEAPLGTTAIRLGWNGFSGKNTLAYYKNL